MKKSIIALVVLMTTLLNCSVALAHNENESSDQQQQSTATATADDFIFVTDSANSTVTMKYADGSPLANVAVTVKNSTSGQEGDIEQNQSADANGVFDYSKWLDQGVAVLRVTATGGTIEYNIEAGTMTIEAGKSNSGSGDKSGGTNSQASQSDSYVLIGAVAAVVVIASIGVVVMQKKKKAKFEAQKKSKGKGKSKKSDSDK